MLKSPFKKVPALKAGYFIKKRLQHRRFPVNIAKNFKNIYFQKTAASAHSVSNLEKWETENIKLHQGDGLISGIFRSSPSKGLKKILVLNIISNSKKTYLVKFANIYNVLEHLWMANSVDSDDKICFSIITDPLNPIGCSFEKKKKTYKKYLL